MPKNIGGLDRIIRLLLAIVIASLAGFKVFGAGGTVLLTILAAILLLTFLIGFCPIYYPFKISTLPKEKKRKSIWARN